MTQFTDDLLLLEELRRSGSLTPDEFALAKAKLLTGSADIGAVQVQAQLAAQTDTKLRRLELQNEMLRLEDEWRKKQEARRYRGDTTTRWRLNLGSVCAIIVAIVLIIFLVVTNLRGERNIWLLFSPIIAIAVALAFDDSKQRKNYKEIEAVYLARKAELEAQLAALESNRKRVVPDADQEWLRNTVAGQ